MEAISAHSLLAILHGYGVGGSLRRHGLVKDRVEAGIVPCLGKSLHHVADQGDRLGIVQGGKDHRLLEVLEHLVRDPLVPVEACSGMHHAVAHRVDCRHPRPADRVFQQAHWISVGCIACLRGSLVQLPPLGIAKGEPSLAAPDSADLARKQFARVGSNFVSDPSPASKMENLIDEDPLLITSMYILPTISTLHR